MTTMIARISRVLLCLVAFVSLSANVGAQTFTALPTSQAFGNQAVGSTSVPKAVTVKNTAASPLTFTLTVTGDYAATNACGGTVNPGATCAVSVTFKPTALGSRPGSLKVADAANS